MNAPTFVDGWFLPADALNEPMRASLAALVSHAKRARWTNATVRQDGKESTYEADWIKALVPFGSAQADAAISQAAIQSPTCKQDLQVATPATQAKAAVPEPAAVQAPEGVETEESIAADAYWNVAETMGTLDGYRVQEHVQTMHEVMKQCSDFLHDFVGSDEGGDDEAVKLAADVRNCLNGRIDLVRLSTDTTGEDHGA